MQVSEAWLRELVNPSVNTKQLIEQMTMAGLEVDSVTPAAAEFSKVVVAEVVAMAKHTNADKLNVCQVNVGKGEPIQIVCGANNVKVGLKVPAALVGALLPGDFKIKKSKLRGELSFGMLCSEKELGLATDASGLMKLSDNAPVGVDLREYLQLADNIIDIDLTPNRADCLSVEGIAREIAVLNNMDWSPVSVKKTAVKQHSVLEVNVDEPSLCPRYLGRLIKNVNPKTETPLWIQERLRRSGIRCLGALIDVTNYVLLELGQPLHAFDADRLNGSITIRRSQAEEELELLNGQLIKLDGEALVIADQQRALALAGIMGGSQSAVNDATQTIFLECAFFTPLAIAGKARDFGLHTDSSHRFERGVDFTLQSRAIERATQLIIDISGGVAGPVTEVKSQNNLPQRQPIKLRRQRIEKVLGVNIDDEQIVAFFKGLEMQIESDAEGWQITPPGFRFDIAIEADLLEEIGRLYGYNNLPNSDLLVRSALGKVPEGVLSLDRVKDLLIDKDYQEVITYSFVDQQIQEIIAPEEEFIRLQNPISSEMAVMRTTLWCGLLGAALYNSKRQQNRIRLFESGLRFVKENGKTLQQPMMAGLILGNVNAEQWGEKGRKVDFFDIKADLQALFSLTGRHIKFSAAHHPALHPGQTALLTTDQREHLGWLGMLHPTVEKQMGFDTQVFLFEFNLEKLLDKMIPVFSTLSKFPSVRRDMAVIVAENISAAEIIDCIQNCQETAVKELQIFDIYRGEGVEEGYKSVALRLTLQEFTKTLTDSEIDAIFSRVLETLSSKLNAKLRD